MQQTLERKIHGVIVPIPAPVINGVFGIQELTDLVRDLAARGVHGFVFYDDMAEYGHESAKERIKALEKIASIPRLDTKLVFGTTHTTSKATIELSKFAESIGADAILLNPSYYGTTFDHVYDVQKNTANVPVLVYNGIRSDGKPAVKPLDALQILTGENRISEDFHDESDSIRKNEYARRIVGIVDNSGSLSFLSGWIAIRDKYAPWMSVLQADEKALMRKPSWLHQEFFMNPNMYIDGIVSATAIYDPELMLRIFNKIKDKDWSLKPEFDKLKAYHRGNDGGVPIILR